ncbi:hypothetical protein [Streptomyces sp. NPDC002564]|uniref:hypothetical protein n=1 Tax=Streptomyces sp. NPDC002564 TaxID=3364649 RepID=UPI003677775E
MTDALWVVIPFSAVAIFAAVSWWRHRHVKAAEQRAELLYIHARDHYAHGDAEVGSRFLVSAYKARTVPAHVEAAHATALLALLFALAVALMR